MFLSIVTIKFTTAGSKVVRDIYYNYVFTVQVLQEFLMVRCTPKLVYLWKGTHRNLWVGLTEISGRTVPRPLTRPQEFLVAYKCVLIIPP